MLPIIYRGVCYLQSRSQLQHRRDANGSAAAGDGDSGLRRTEKRLQLVAEDGVEIELHAWRQGQRNTPG